MIHTDGVVFSVAIDDEKLVSTADDGIRASIGGLKWLSHTIVTYEDVRCRVQVGRDICGATVLCACRMRTHVEHESSQTITKLRGFWVGSAHVRSQATVHAFMHAVCMRAEDIDTRLKERA